MEAVYQRNYQSLLDEWERQKKRSRKRRKEIHDLPMMEQIFPLLMEFLSDQAEGAGSDVLVFVREAIHRLPHLCPFIMHQLLDVFPLIRNPNVYRSALWILGEYSDTSELITRVFALIKKSIGELPFVDMETSALLEDASETTSDATAPKTEKVGRNQCVLRPLSFDDIVHCFIAQAIGYCRWDVRHPVRLCRWHHRLREVGYPTTAEKTPAGGKLFHRLRSSQHIGKIDTPHGRCKKRRLCDYEALFLISSVIHLGKSGLCKNPITEDDLDRLSSTLRLIVD